MAYLYCNDCKCMQHFAVMILKVDKVVHECQVCDGSNYLIDQKMTQDNLYNHLSPHTKVVNKE